VRDLFRTEQAILEVGPEGDAELATGLLQAGKRVATAAVLATFLILRYSASIDESRWPWTGYRDRGPN
jgi:hypothetical protein